MIWLEHRKIVQREVNQLVDNLTKKKINRKPLINSETLK